MVRKIKAKLVLQLRIQNLSRRAVECAYKISRHSIQAVLGAAQLAGLGWDDVTELSEAEVYAALFPGRGVRESAFAQPDWARVHTELARVGVTLKLLHQEYLEAPSCYTSRCLVMDWSLWVTVERRYGETSMVFCTQYSQRDWHQRLGSGVHADAIMDRIIHNTIWVEAGTYNMREHTALASAYSVTEVASGSQPHHHWRSLARTVVLNRTIRWCSKPQILSVPT